MDMALANVKVVDLTYGVAGPYCTKLLADYGAEVIKVESPGEGDIARRAGPFPDDIPQPEKSGRFLNLNTDKRGITLNVDSQAGAGILRELVAWADVLVENFQPGYLDGLGLGYEALEAVNPRLVMTSITPFGQTGPHRGFKDSEIVAMATCTLMARHGDPDREPLKYYGDIGHYFAGTMAVVPTIGALVHVWMVGVGQHVDVSIQEALLSAVDRGGLRYVYTGLAEERQRASQRGANYPTGIFPCKDGHIAVLGGGSRRWPRVGRVIDIPDLMYDPRFKTDTNREANLPELEALWLGWLSQHTMAEIFEKSTAERLPVAPVYTTEDLLNDRHYRERGFWVDVEHPVAGTFTYPGAPFKMSESPWQIRRPAPLLGEHNEEVYCGLLGRSREELVVFRSQGII